jgi:hypothetical protein
MVSTVKKSGFADAFAETRARSSRHAYHKTKAFQFADDALIAPPRILLRETKD